MAFNLNSDGSKLPHSGTAGLRIFLIGFMGCGKTHWGHALSNKLGLPFFDLDHQIEEKEEKSITAIFSEQGEEFFRLLEKDVLHLITESHESFVMATGGGTPCFYNNIGYMKHSGSVVWLNCPIDCIYNRLIKEQDKRPLINGLSENDLHAYIVKKFSDRKIYYEQATITIADENLDVDGLVTKIFHA